MDDSDHHEQLLEALLVDAKMIHPGPLSSISHTVPAVASASQRPLLSGFLPSQPSLLRMFRGKIVEQLKQAVRRLVKLVPMGAKWGGEYCLRLVKLVPVGTKWGGECFV